MRAIIYSKFNQNETIRRKLLSTGDKVLYKCTKNRWWGCGLRLDAKEWELDGACPGLNKMGTILMEVRTALKKRMCNHKDALSKSPGALIRSVAKLSQEICERQGMVAAGTDVSATVPASLPPNVVPAPEPLPARLFLYHHWNWPLASLKDKTTQARKPTLTSL